MAIKWIKKLASKKVKFSLPRKTSGMSGSCKCTWAAYGKYFDSSNQKQTLELGLFFSTQIFFPRGPKCETWL